MWAYIVRRILWTIPIILGIVVIIFVLFGVVAKDPALVYAGKIHSPQQLAAIRHKMGLDKPKWINIDAASKEGFWHAFDSQFFDILFFRFPKSMRYDESVWTLFARKAPISLAIQLPVFIIELGLQLVLALFVAARRGRWQDYLITTLAVFGLSIPALSIYMGAQWFFGAYLKAFPVAGWELGWHALPFMALPILVSVIGGLGGGTRFYRTVALEEIGAEYVRTARAKGISEREVLLTHVLRNVLIPVLTNTVVALPALLTGALILERLFQIPGFGGLLVDSIYNNDRSVVMAIVYVTSVVYCIMLLITDILYTLVDPRVSLK
jgi:peptide/nickel transport system permease protein